MRLIDADELMRKLQERDLALCVTEWDIKEAPTIDAVPVVRCGECEFSRKVDNREPMYKCVNICRYGCTQWVGSDDFCSYGERRNYE